MAGEHGAFPDAAFIELAVAHQHIGLEIFMRPLRRQGDARAIRQAQAETAAGVFNTLGQMLGRLSGKASAIDFIGKQVGAGNDAGFMHGYIITQSAMALAQNETVPILPVRIVLLQAQNLEIEHSHDFHNRKGRPDMRTVVAGLMRQMQDVLPHAAGSRRALPDWFRTAHLSPPSTRMVWPVT